MGLGVADDSLAFFVRYDHHDAIAETLSLSFLLGRYFHLLASVFHNDVTKNFHIFEKPRHTAHYLHLISDRIG